jgi:hypothetical protein
VSGETFDRNFENYVEDLMERSRLTAAAPRLPEAGATVASDDLQEIASVKDPRYLAALRLVGQYGWAGGTFNTNELSYLIQTSSSARTTRAFILARGARPIGLAVCSSIAPKLVIIHEMVVQQTITRDALFAHFWSILHPQIERSFGPTHCLVAEVPKNDPRHLKTEVFARGLSSAGFTATAWPYYLPSGFNSRSTPSLAQLAIRAPEVSRQLFLDIVNHLYSALYRSLWSNMTPAPGEFDAELHRLEALIVKDLDAS